MLPSISPTTLTLFTGVVYALLSITVWVTLRRQRSTPHVDLWTAGSLCLGLGVILLALRPEPPQWWVLMLTNTLLISSNMLRVVGLSLDPGLPLQLRRAGGLWLLAVTVFAAVLAFGSTQWRVGVALLLHAAGNGLVAYFAMRSAQRIPSRSGLVLAAVEWLVSAAVLQRALAVLGGSSPPSTLSPELSFWLLAATMIAAALYGNLGYLGMEFDRLGEAELRARREQLEETARREAAERSAVQLRAAIDQRDRLASERDQLLQMLAHEIRQPLHNASGALQAAAMLVQAPQPADSAEVSGRLVRAQVVLGDVRSVLDNTLAAALMLTRRDPLVVQDVDLHLLAHLVLGDLPDAQRARIRVEWYTPLRSAELEPGMVRLALRNLMRNAFEHGGPEVIVTLRIEDQEHPPAVVLTVADNGIGRPGPTLEEGGAPLAPPSAGSPDAVRRGLGLVIVRRVMALHHGRLVLAQNWPRGLQARLVFPDPTDNPPDNGPGASARAAGAAP
ncbi:sensor histidine kinase [Aquabacterium sp. OR-4]|uniref:sensor histidine kinase n=1 Tax=Aquabacterium sp. OR-4 TaxID=2978127 RepID=UPI0028C9792C|nr:ATP-binding protein [Aquabacterium sp. OR-4]MDT7836671.1 ATP-binding protein [Aquabacterium sp. OR-4]